MQAIANNSRALQEAARTICLAFSNDALIRWLRPSGTPWSECTPDILEWQRRRLMRVRADGGILLKLPVTAPIAPPTPGTKTIQEASDTTGSSKIVPSTDAEFAAVAILFPPKQRIRWTMQRVLLSLKLMFLDLVMPIPDKGSNDQRFECMMKNHDSQIADLEAKVGSNRLWYLEVIAVRPAMHGKGLGSKLMRSILQEVKDDPIVLECTEKSNVPFYKKFGFSVVEEVELQDEKDEDDSVTLTIMVRE